MFTPLWGRWEASFIADDQPEPNTQLTLNLTAPSGRDIRAAAFWDGGRTWRVRFMPDEEGAWRYRTVSEPADTSLNGRSGEFVCRRIESDNPFLRHGPIRTGVDGWRLAHADGTPFFLLGDTAWNGPMLAQAADWDLYLADRVAKRFSAIQCVTHAPFIGTFTNAEGEVATSHLPSMPVNPHFFRRIDARLDAVNAAGLLAIPVLAWAATWNEHAIPYNVGCTLLEDQLIRFVRYQLARYQAHHVIWLLPGDGVYEGAEAEKWKRVGRAAFAGFPHAPVSLHPAGRHWPYDAFLDEEWLGVYGYQSSHSISDIALEWLHSGPPATAWQAAPPRPVINLEPPYEDHVGTETGERFDAYAVRRACYWSLLAAPTAGLTYGAHGLWAWHEQPELPLFHPRTGVGQPWHVAKDLPGSRHMQVMAECFMRLSWWTLRPDRDLVLNQLADGDPKRVILAARSDSGDLAVVYLPVGGEVRLARERLGTGLLEEWYDPRTAARHPAQALAPGRYHAPDAQDWVLVLSAG